MRRLLAAVLGCLLALSASAQAGPAVPVSPVVPGVPGDALASPNVTHVGTLPLDGVGVSLRTVRVGRQVRAFVSGATGLSVYDATDPRRPLLLGHLPIYNWENEDIAVSQDGRTAILTEFTGTFYLHVVDVSDPTLPVVVGSLALKGSHTAECADRRCDFLFGSEGQTYDLRDRSHPRELPPEQSWGVLTGAGAGHNLHRDAAGIWISDTDPLVVFREAPDPLHLKVLTRGTITKNTQYQHNNIRPRADRWKPRGRLGGPLRDGELLLGEGETNFEPQCNGSNGAFSTWSMAGFDRGVPMRQLATLRPVSNKALSADPAVNVLGCSGHWFTEQDATDGSILVAAGWYEHGTRFLSVDPRTGAIRQVGWFQPERGATSGAYWMSRDVVWSVDYHSGIDILAFDQSPAKRPTTAQVDASWLAPHAVDPFAAALRRLCRAGIAATSADHARLHSLVAGA
ncbi:MAG: hypothetical protein WCD35_00495 [Mycobacteriales bacterium]